jgi:UDP-3-O-[3-hydroxymyristoyl] glucosamine N-acyltransferase
MTLSSTVAELAALVGGRALGDSALVLSGVRALDEAAADCVSPLFRRRLLNGIGALPGAALGTEPLCAAALERGVGAAIAHDEPLIALARVIDFFHPAGEARGFVHPSAVVGPGAEVHPSVWIGPGAVLEAGARVGEGSWIGPNAVICGAARIGRFVRIGPCAVIGHEGFGFVPSPDGPVKVRQVGRVEIGDFAEIGAASCVDRGTLGATRVGPGTKLDNLVQVGHNVTVGRRVLIAAQAGLAGSTVVEDDAMIGGQAGVADHLRIGRGARAAGKSGVVGDVAAGATVAGYPAVDHRQWLRSMARLAALAGRRHETGADET